MTVKDHPNTNTALVIATFVGTIAVAQFVFWYFSMPGPQLRGTTNLIQGIVGCVVAALSLFVFPFVVAFAAMGRVPIQLGLGLGNWRFGWRAVLWCAPIMVVGTLIGTNEPAIKDYYPIPGDSIGDSRVQLLVWFAADLLFYIAFEFFYRGFMLGGINDLQTTKVAIYFIALQAICCFLIHIGKPWPELIASFPASILFGWIAWRSRSIWYGVAIHWALGIANDLGAM